MSSQFRELLKKVGSGQHTKKDLTRQEAAEAAKMMLLQEATPAQIGAFMISHRIKRPTPEEIAGFLDTYDQMGPCLQPLQDRQMVVFGVPYDGRSRTAPIIPLTALILASAGVGVVTHGGDIMPTKYGIPLVQIWQGLGLDFTRLSLAQVQAVLEQEELGFVYIPQHFPEAEGLVPYRDQIGKRPPTATLELIWSPLQSHYHWVAGYVHPPTETLFRHTLKLWRPNLPYTLVKGLEGSCDLRLSQTTIIAVPQPLAQEGFEYLKLNPREYGLEGKEIPLESTEDFLRQIEQVLEGKPSPLSQAVLWNGGFYLWRCGVCADLALGIEKAKSLLVSGEVAQKREDLVKAIAL